MDLVPITPEYYDFVRDLRMHPETRNGFLEEANISIEDQRRYMEIHGDNYYICLLYDEPVGYIGVIDDDIRICTSPLHQRCGIGKFMLKSIKDLYPTAMGRVKKENTSSQRLFDSCEVNYKLI